MTGRRTKRGVEGLLQRPEPDPTLGQAADGVDQGLDLVTTIRDALNHLETRTHDRLGPRAYKTLLTALTDIQDLAREHRA